MKLIVFDFDGTLVDSRALIWECHRLVFTEFGLPVPSPQDSLAQIGRSLDLVLGHLAGPGAPVPEMVKAHDRVKVQLQAEHCFAERPFDGMADLLHRVSRTSNTVLGIATGATSTAVAPALDALGWRDLFQTIQGADMAPSKPHPGMLLQALKATGARPENAAFVGDTSFDMEMARAAKLRPIGVAWGYHTPDQLLAAGASHVARSVGELRDILSEVGEPMDASPT